MRQRLFAPSVLLLASVLPAACATSQPDLSGALAVQLAEVMVSHQAYDAAVPILRRELIKDPENPNLHRLLGAVLRDKGLHKQAEQELLIALQLMPDNPEMHVALGILYDLKSESKMAESYHRQALALYKHDARYYNNLGFNLYLQARYEEAIEVYTDGLRLDPMNHRLYTNLGFAQARLGAYEDARRSFEEAAPKAMALSNLGLAYELQGKLNEAQAHYELALVHDEQLDVAQKHLHRLAKGETLTGHDLGVAEGRDVVQ